MKYFLSGIATITNIFGAFTPNRILDDRTDAEALASDWQQVGDDIRYALGQYAEENAARRK